MTVEELQKQVQQLTSQLASMGAGAAQPGENPYSVASRLSQGAKAAADAADGGMAKPVPMPNPESRPVPMPGADPVPDPNSPALSPEEARIKAQIRANELRAGLLMSEMDLFNAQRPRGRVRTSSRMPTDPWDAKFERQFGMSQEMKNFYGMSEADQKKVQARAAGAGMDVAGFLGLSPLEQFNAINGRGPGRTMEVSPGEGGVAKTMEVRHGEGGTVIPLSNRPAVTRNMSTSSIPNAQFTSFDSGVRTVIGSNSVGGFVRGASAPINASRKSSEIARDLNYRSNLAGAALDSLRRPAMRFGL